MKKILTLLVLLLVAVGISKADLGAPTIQAVCKVTLLNGETIEGIISFGSGGYEYNYKPHGFCFVHDNGFKELVLYNFSFKQFIPENNGAFRSKSSSLYYVENVSKQRMPEKKSEFDEKNRILTNTVIDIDEYKLLEQMVLYRKLPLDLYVGYSQKNEDDKILIKVTEIKSVEILKQPGQLWLDMINDARIRLGKQIDMDIEKDDMAWIDYAEPSWYHEVILDEKLVAYLKQFFH